MENDNKGTYTLELDWDEVSVIVEALRIQRERWQKAALEAMAGQPIGGISVERASQLLDRHAKLLKRLPDHGLVV